MLRKLKASTILCKTKIEKAKGVLACPDGKMCADGILAHEMGYSVEDLMNTFYVPLNKFERRGTPDQREEVRQKFYRKVKERYGINKQIWHDIAYHSDKGWTFKKIGNWLKGKGL